ncbi:MAG TPA: DHHA1 domain-containing protein, partial [Spirochaetota bacterium]|nr:DHHA1 domain-containing protein [Spirochaetota bacterium]
LTDTIRRFKTHVAILVYNNMSIVDMLTGFFRETKVFDFADFITRIVKSEISGLEHFIRISAARQILDHEKMSYINSIFLDAQLSGSDKISAFINSAMGLVAIGSIADVIPLVEENRLLVKRGIDILNRKRSQAITLLLNGAQINSKAIGWNIAPLLNTPGRIGKTELAVQFFLENDRAALKKIISEIRALNDDRRSFINEFCSSTLREIKQEPGTDSLIVIKTDRIPEGYAGLVANRISDETGKPTIVVVLPGKQGLIKGSGRSRSGGSFFSIVEQFRERFDRIGGHENAFGFTVRADDVDDIMTTINNALDSLTASDNPQDIDCELDPGMITCEFIDQISRLEPFGTGNEEPLFFSRKVNFKSFSLFGKNHGKYLVEGDNGLTAIGWNMGAMMKDFFESGKPLDIVYRLENNSFNGSVSPRMIIQGILFAG